MDSSVSGAQFIGSQGTNYTTLSDTGDGTAPEPGALTVPALGELAAGVVLRR